jgi:hypothetical protein
MRTLSLVTQGEIQKKPTKEDISIQGGMKLRKPLILVVKWVSSCLSFFLSASTAAASIFSASNCTTTIISLGPCALNAEFQHSILSWSISYWDLIKCLYFADTTERRDRGVRGGPKTEWRQGYCTLFSPDCLVDYFVFEGSHTLLLIT